MNLLAPLGLLGLLAVPAILLLHTLRRRLRERRVAGLFLFAPDAMTEDAGRTRTTLLRTPSLWLELAAAALLGVSLALPQVDETSSAPHLVAVLDDTASMAAVVDGASAADRAREALRAQLNALPGDATVTLLRTGRPPQALAGPRTDRATALAALRVWRPVAPSHDAGPALELARQLAGPRGQVTFLTDDRDAEAPDEVETVAVGRPASNVAIAHATREPAGELETVYLDLVAHAAEPTNTDLRIRAGRGASWHEVVSRTVTVAPGGASRLTLDVPASDLDLRITLSDDALALDGEVVLLPVPGRVVPFAISMQGTTRSFVRADRLARALVGVVEVPEADAALVISDVDAPAAPGVTRLVIAASGVERDDWLGPFLLDRADDLTEGLALEGVVWSSGRGEITGRGIVFAGTRALLAIDEAAGGGTRIVLDLDPARSTLFASTDGPILFSNVVERVRRTLPGPVSVSAAVGTAVAYRPSARDGELSRFRLVAPSGASSASAARAPLVFDVEEVGVHALRSPEGEVARYGVWFVDAVESDLTRRSAGTRPPRDALVGMARDVARAGAGTPVRALAILALAVLVADAWVLSRRRRARA